MPDLAAELEKAGRQLKGDDLAGPLLALAMELRLNSRLAAVVMQCATVALGRGVLGESSQRRPILDGPGPTDD